MRIVQLKRRPTPKVDSMTVLRARRGRTGSKYVTLRGGRRRSIPFLLVRSGGCARSSILREQTTERSCPHAYAGRKGDLPDITGDLPPLSRPGPNPAEPAARTA